ncbi:MAG: hypothetical protein WBN43_09185, partial [Thiogranum sp.]
MDEKRVHPPLFGRKAFPKDCRMVQTHCPGFVLREAHFGLLQNLMRSSPQCMEAGPIFSVSTGWGFNDERFAWASLLLSGLVTTQKSIPTQLQTRKNRLAAVRSSFGIYWCFWLPIVDTYRTLC